MNEDQKTRDGVFGTERERCGEAISPDRGKQERSIFRNRRGTGLPAVNGIADIVIFGLYAALAVASILGIVFWDSFGNALFFNFLFPVLTVGGQIILIVAVIALIGLFLCARMDFMRYRHRWF